MTVPSTLSDSARPSLTIPTSTIHAFHELVPRITSPPSPSCCPNQVVVELHTTLLISDYSKYYDTPIYQFQPSYLSSPDGSLLATPYIEDRQNANAHLFVNGILFMLFLRNIFVSGDYIRRAKIRRKMLFHVLFISQMASMFALIPVIVTHFSQRPSCRAVLAVASLSGAVSLALLIVWILGYKAYKCLDNSRYVLLPLVLLLCASSALVVLEMLHLSTERRLTGSCIRTDDFRYTRIYIALQFLESFFISGCFFCALWKSRNSPAARGRISVQLSLEDFTPDDDNADMPPRKQSWRDYVPEKEASSPSSQPTRGFLAFLLPKFATSFSGNGSSRPLRKPSVTGDVPIPQPPRPSTVRISVPPTSRPPSGHLDTRTTYGRNSPSPSSINSRLSKLMPRMELFRDVMKDELCYTTFITVSCVAVAILAIIGVYFENPLSVMGWVSLNWAIVSLLAVHSFGRVVRRHERDAVLQEPGTWQSPVSERSRPGPWSAGRRRESNAARVTTPLRRVRRFMNDTDDLDDQSNPFSDTRALNQRESVTSWNSGSCASSYDMALPPEKAMSFSESKACPVPSPSLLIEDSAIHDQVGFRDSSDGTLVQGFRQSSLYASSSSSPGPGRFSSGHHHKNVPPHVL